MIIETICIMMILYYDCDWTLSITPGISCNGEPAFGCTYYDSKVIYLSKWNACTLFHEITEHAQKKNNFNHRNVCNQW